MVVEADDVGLLIGSIIVFVPNSSWTKCGSICQAAEAWSNLGHQQDNNTKIIVGFKWPSQRPDFNVTEILISIELYWEDVVFWA